MNNRLLRKKVLIVSYYAPPIGLSGVQRVTKLAKFLPEFGWQPILLTVKPISYFLYDPKLLNDLTGIKIYRSESLDLARILYFWQREKPITSRRTGPLFLNYLLFPDAKVLWLPFAYSLGKKVLEKERPNLIFATGPPYSALVLGVLLKQKAKVPLISDFRDPYPTGFTPPPFHFRLLVQLLRRYILNSSDAVVAVNQGTASRLEKGAVIIENGYDPTEFEIEENIPKKVESISVFYAGTLWENETDLFAFLNAIRDIKNLQVFIAGRASVACQHQLKNFNNVNYLGVLSHQAVIRWMKSADLLLYLTKPHQPVGLKLYEYFGAGKPIIAVSEDCNEAIRLIEHHNAGLGSSLKSEEITATVLQIIKQKNSFSNQPIEWYSRKNQARRLAELFNQLANYEAHSRFH